MKAKRIVILAACLILVTAVSSVIFVTASTNRASEMVFKTPEEAITFYLEGVTQGDLTKVWQASAVNEMGENFRFDLYIERIRAFMPFASQSPASYPFYVEINKAELASRIASQVKILAFSLLSSEPVAEGKTILMEVDRANAFIEDVDPSRLAQIAVQKIGIPLPAIMATTKHQENMAKNARIYGADEVTERVVLFTFEQEYFYMGFTLMRFGEGWKVSGQSSVLGNTGALGAPERTTPADFETLISAK